jgi:methylated-DNA-[protein]-cysteine S-methyltransferase
MLKNSDFDKLVFEQIEKIPYGKTKSYKEIAAAIGKPKAYRAVANACGKNPIPIIRPCHRVVCSDGKTGGYSLSGGAKLKSILLKIESKHQ